MAILSEKQIAAVKKHRYSVEGTSIMDFLDVLYLWMAKKIHPRVTANLVTIIGLVSVILSCSIVAYFSYIGDHQVSHSKRTGLSLHLSINNSIHLFMKLISMH